MDTPSKFDEIFEARWRGYMVPDTDGIDLKLWSYAVALDVTKDLLRAIGLEHAENERLRAPRAWGEVQNALQCLQDDFDGKGAGVSGLRAQAMAHLKQALVLREIPIDGLRRPDSDR